MAIYHAASIDWSFAELPDANGPVEREMIGRGLVAENEIRSWSKQPITFKDEMWTRAAVHIIERHKPNLLLMHLLTTDSVQHQYGARSLAAQTALILADRQIQRILDAVERAGLRDSTTLVVLSDHGFKSYQHLIRANVLLRQKGLLRDNAGQLDGDAWVVAEGGTAMVYVTRESRREATLKALNDAFPQVSGIAKIILPADYPQYGYPPANGQGRMADMVLAAGAGYAFDAATTGDLVSDVPAGAVRGNHGYLSSDPDMTAILVMWGAGIQPGAHSGIESNLNVAPTLAQLLHVKLPDAQGTALTGFLRK